MPEKLKAKANAPAHSYQRSARTNSSSTIILTNRSGEYQKGMHAEEEKHLNSLFLFII